MNFCGEIAWKKTARIATSVQSRAMGSTYQKTYFSSWTSKKPFEAWTATPATALTSSVTISTRASARVLGTMKVQSGAGVASTISWVLRSRSRQTSSPA